jgi:glycosyltransferase involved in cell wall biosynthesis
MSFGCPSVATRVGGIPEVVEDGVSGLLVPSGDVDGLARAAERLIQDPTARKVMGQTARARARERFSADRIVPLYVELYRRVCALPSRPQ